MSKQPDIIIFNPDQWRADVMGHLGNPAAHTPNLDSFVATDAVSFANAFCQNPVCTPSRCSFMTGWYPHVRGHRTMHHMLHLNHGEPNLLQILKKAGYFVWWGGKNDLTPGQESLEPHCDIRFRPTAADYQRWGLTKREDTHGGDLAWRGQPEGDNYYSFMKGKLEKGEEPLYCDDDWAVILGAIDFLNDYDGDQPLCLFLALGYPHPPYCVEEPWFSIIDRQQLPPRIPAPADWRGKPSLLAGIYHGQGLQGWDEARWDELRATYYGMCARLDHQFGRLLTALKQTGRYDQAAVFLFSDHGDFTGDYGLVEKTQNTMEDVLTKVPFIVKLPAGTPSRPRISHALIELIDFTATVYDLLGIDPGYDSFGRSLLPLIAGRTDSHRDAVFCEGGRRRGERQASEIDSWPTPKPDQFTGLYAPRLKLQVRDDKPYHTKAAMCRTATHKLVRRQDESDELYDLTADPHEQDNRINDPDYQLIRSQLQERLLHWYMETCDIVPQQADQRRHLVPPSGTT